MKITLPVLSWIILPILILSAGIFSQAKASSPAIVAQDSSVSAVAALPVENQSAPVTGASPETAATTTSGPLTDFIATVKNGQAGQVVGVYVLNILALKVVQQPANQPGYVNEKRGYATQFSLAAQYGTTGLLAHNYLSGGLFFSLSTGQEVDVVYGDGAVRRYTISSLRHFQAINPTNPNSKFVDLDNKGSAQISSSDLFYQIYAKGDQVVFQTCITANGNTSWGRLFVIATPAK